MHDTFEFWDEVETAKRDAEALADYRRAQNLRAIESQARRDHKRLMAWVPCNDG